MIGIPGQPEAAWGSLGRPGVAWDTRQPGSAWGSLGQPGAVPGQTWEGWGLQAAPAPRIILKGLAGDAPPVALWGHFLATPCSF